MGIISKQEEGSLKRQKGYVSGTFIVVVITLVVVASYLFLDLQPPPKPSQSDWISPAPGRPGGDYRPSDLELGHPGVPATRPKSNSDPGAPSAGSGMEVGGLGSNPSRSGGDYRPSNLEIGLPGVPATREENAEAPPAPSIISRVITYPLEGIWQGEKITKEKGKTTDKQPFLMIIKGETGDKGTIQLGGVNTIIVAIQKEGNKFLIQGSGIVDSEFRGRIDHDKISGTWSTTWLFGSFSGTFSATRRHL